MTETAKERLMRGLEEVIDFETKVMKINEINPAVNKTIQIAVSAITESNRLPDSSVSTDKLSVEKLEEQLEECIQTLIEASTAASITKGIVIGNLVDRKLADLAKTHKRAADYIEKVTGKNIDDVLAENATIEGSGDE